MKTVIEIAREAAGDDWGLFQEFMPEIHRIVELVRADERARMAEQTAQQWNAGVPSLYPEPEQGVSIKVEYEQPGFFTHNVEHPYDWSEWVCPDPKSYLMKCCDCGLVHEAEFGVVRYKSETEREDCDMVDDPNLQAVFRMRRSEQWSSVDTAHRAGGLPMEQPEQQEPYCWMSPEGTIYQASDEDVLKGSIPMYLGKPPAHRKPLTDEEIESIYDRYGGDMMNCTRAIERAHGIKENT